MAKDIDGRLTYANPATLELIGKPPNEVAGSKVADFLSDKDSALRVKDNDRRIVDSGVGEDEGATWPQSRCQRSTVGCRRDSASMAWYQFARQLRGDQLNAACVSSGSIAVRGQGLRVATKLSSLAPLHCEPASRGDIAGISIRMVTAGRFDDTGLRG